MKDNAAIKNTLSAAFWLALWQAAAMLIGSRIILPAPTEVLRALPALFADSGFPAACLTSLWHIMLGFSAAALLGVALAVLAHRFPAAKQLLQLPMAAVKATPVAAFVLMAFFLFGSQWLGCFIAALLALPVFYTNVLQGLQAVPKAQLEAAALYALPQKTQFLRLYLPAAVPYFLSACEAAVGMSWKAGVAAEVIAIARGSIGEALYDAKLLVDTPTVFAVTLVTVALSLLCEKAVMALARALCKKLM